MKAPNDHPARQLLRTPVPLPRLVLLPALHPDADPRPALLPAHPRAAPTLFASVPAATAALRQLQGAITPENDR